MSYELQLVLKCKIPSVNVRMKSIIYTFPHVRTILFTILGQKLVQILLFYSEKWSSHRIKLQKHHLLTQCKGSACWTQILSVVFLFSFSPKHQQSSWLETPPQLFEMTFPCLLPTQRKNAPPTALHHSFLFSRHVDLLMSMHSMFLYTHLHCFYSTEKRSQYNVGSCKLVPKVKAKGNGIHKSERLIVNETSRARQIALPGASPLACIPTWDK